MAQPTRKDLETLARLARAYFSHRREELEGLTPAQRRAWIELHLVEPFQRLGSEIRALAEPSRDEVRDLDALVEVYQRMFGLVFAIFGPAPSPEQKSDVPFCLLVYPFTRAYPEAEATERHTLEARKSAPRAVAERR
ncbi:MAG: hypothetical protein U0229_22805 [Anaeromyxobacter sp.]